MPSLFSDKSLWSQSEFTFTIKTLPKGIDKRGNRISEEKKVKVLFKLRPSSKKSANRIEESYVEGKENYECRVVAVDGNYENVKLPTQINLGDVGEGEINDRKCRAIVRSLAQSSLAQILVGNKPLLGEKVILEIDYTVRYGNRG